jgi:ribonuclease Y
VLSESALYPLLVGILLALLALGLGSLIATRTVRRARQGAARLLAVAGQEGEAKARETVVAAQEAALAIQEEAERRQHELDAREVSLEARARQLDGDASTIERDRRALERRHAEVSKSEEVVRQASAAASADRIEARHTLERTAGLTAEEARAELVASIQEEATREAARLARRVEEDARESAEREAQHLVIRATQRVHLREALESTVSYIELPSDDMKGRIIGREGRNIRALEMATGIDVIVDDTPQAILISSFDPVRREIAKIAIGRLIEDGRIHPARIEEVVTRVAAELESIVEEAGTQAAFNLGVSDLHPRLARLLGRTRLRTHHGQNLLQHSTEVALIAAHMAAEVGARMDVARRAGLLHEIGRVEENASGHTVLVSAELAGKFGETDQVVHAIQSLHPEVEPKTVEALLLRTANRLSDHRPGARKDNLQVFVERLKRLEAIAAEFPGVLHSYALKAGKEIRVIVDAKALSDEEAFALSKRVARAIEKDLDYQGQIKVSVVRETRAVQFAV